MTVASYLVLFSVCATLNALFYRFGYRFGFRYGNQFSNDRGYRIEVAQEQALEKLADIESYLEKLVPEPVEEATVKRAQAIVHEAADLLDNVSELIDSGTLVFKGRATSETRQKTNGYASLLFDRSSELRRVKVAPHRGTLRVSLYEHRVLNADSRDGVLEKKDRIISGDAVR